MRKCIGTRNRNEPQFSRILDRQKAWCHGRYREESSNHLNRWSRDASSAVDIRLHLALEGVECAERQMHSTACNLHIFNNFCHVTEAACDEATRCTAWAVLGISLAAEAVQVVLSDGMNAFGAGILPPWSEYSVFQYSPEPVPRGIAVGLRIGLMSHTDNC